MGQNTEKSPVDMRRLATTQNPVKDLQLTLVGKTHKDLEVGRRVETIQNDSIAEDSQNPETSPGDLRRLAVTQTPVKNHQLTLMWKTLED